MQNPEKTPKKMRLYIVFPKKCVPLQSILDNGNRFFNNLKDSLRNANYSTVSEKRSSEHGGQVEVPGTRSVSPASRRLYPCVHDDPEEEIGRASCRERV